MFNLLFGIFKNVILITFYFQLPINILSIKNVGKKNICLLIIDFPKS